MEIKAGTLYIVGTPIGNLEDMTFRAVSVLQQVDLIAAEDTRHTGKLLQHFQVKTPQISHHEHNLNTRVPELVDRLSQGKSIALVTDAGMPCISDPGYELVRACREAGVNVVPIPGVTAVVTALAASGLPSERFTFEGFLPAKAKARSEALEALRSESRTMVFYEAPHRLLDMLGALKDGFGGDRLVSVGRELTKLHEAFWSGDLAGAIVFFETNEPRGEFTVVVAGADGTVRVLSEEEIAIALRELIVGGMSRSEASKQLSQQLGLGKRQIYQLALSLEID
jgi:16S rRNA (cytidine1402-2'-O)-methyltransferase